MRLGLNLGYWGSGPSRFADDVALAVEADRLDYAVVWAAEAYGSDSPTVLSYLAARTTRIDLGSAVMQIPARTPACTAMTAATLDSLSGGRFRLGLGVSGPLVSEGWHGVRFEDPLGRTREYVDVVRLALGRQPLAYEGKHLTLPLPDGPGKALRLGIRPVRPRIPLYLASVGPRNLELTGEVADGWLAVFFSPEHAASSLDRLRAGRARAGHDGLEGFDVAATVPVVLGEDLEACAEPVRAHTALYLGGMGGRGSNFYSSLAVRMGYAEAAEQVQEHFLAGRQREAAAAVPLEFIERTALVGPVERVADRIAAYAGAGVTTLSVTCQAGTLEARLRTLRTLANLVPAGLRSAVPAEPPSGVRPAAPPVRR